MLGVRFPVRHTPIKVELVEMILLNICLTLGLLEEFSININVANFLAKAMLTFPSVRGNDPILKL